MFISALKGVPAKPAAAASKPPAQIIIKTAPTQANSRDSAVVEMQKHVHDLTSALINEQEDKKQYQLEYERIQDEGRRLFTTYVAKTNRLKEVCVSFSIRWRECLRICAQIGAANAKLEVMLQEKTTELTNVALKVWGSLYSQVVLSNLGN